MTGRKFIKSIILAVIAIGLYAWTIEPFSVEYTQIKMPVHNLPKSLAGKTIMQISDLHIGERISDDFFIKEFKKAQKLQPDFVVYTGDYVSYKTETQLIQLEKVVKYAVRGKLGTIAVLGNHDYGKGWKNKLVAHKITQILKNAGIAVLRNESVFTNGLNFIGIDSYYGTNFKPKKAMKHYKPKEANLVLCHNPDVCDLNVWKNYKGWILAGHTHGGQVKIPFINPPILPVKNKKYSSGRIDLPNKRSLYINRGLGTSIIPLRFNVRPEITIFTLSYI
jgi:predicted MPP superfamily phosphohydrolase